MPSSKSSQAPKRAVFVGVLALAAFALGLPVGFMLWTLLSIAYALCDLVWKGAGAMTGWTLFPLIACGSGGLLIGLWNARFKSAPIPFDRVMARVKREGGYRLERPAASAVSFFLPIAFGGSVGPEAGLMGMIAAGCTWAGSRLRALAERFGLQADARSSRTFLTKGARRVVYAAGVAGGIAGVAAYTSFLPGGMALPRFAAPAAFSPYSALCAFVGVLAGWALVVLYRSAVIASKRIAKAFGTRSVLRTTVCGLVLGGIAIFLPYVLFPGTQQFGSLAQSWQSMAGWMLLATGVAKTCLVAFCLNMGWSGGPYLPLVFCAAVFGYGLASVLGADAMVCVCAVVCSLMGAFVGKFFGAFLFMMLLFAPQSIPLVAVCTAAGAFLPMPEALRPKGMM
ncbi:MAG: chloride channel protein [Slackia sp.]|nr:chloride channel protein [Slackia sp.]